MGDMKKAKAKTAKKSDKAKKKIAAKMGKAAKTAAAVAALALAGCATSDSAQPAKSQTQNNEFKDCVFVMAAGATVSNGVVRAEGGGDASPLEMFTQTQSLESSGTESFAQTATQTPTTDVKPDVNLHYNDAVATGGKVATSFLAQLTEESAALLKSYIDGRKSGTVTVQKKDGTTQTLKCENGSCTVCTDCADQ